MQKVFSPKLIVVLVVAALSLFLTLPTVRYFLAVSSAGNAPTAEQAEKITELRDKGQVIKLGLDLQGGVDFLLAVDVDLLKRRNLENDAEAIRSALGREDVDATVKLLPVAEGTEAAITVVVNDAKDVDVAADTLSEQIDKGAVHLKADGDVRAGLAAGKELKLTPEQSRFNAVVGEAMEGALRVVRERLDKFGLTQPIVTRAGQDRIKVQIPGESNPARIRESLLKTASLEFRLLHPQHDQQIVNFIEGGASGFMPGTGTGRIRKDLIEEIPSPLNAKDRIKRVKDNIAGVPSGYVLRLGRQNHIDKATGQIDKEKSLDDLVYLVKAEVPLGGDKLRRAAVFTDPTALSDPIKVTIDFDREGATIFGQITTDHTEERFAIILDDVVYSAPNINEPILGGRAQISGGFSQNEARDLAVVLKAGALPAPLRVISENAIGPSLGADSIRDSGKAIIIGGVLIIALIITIYGTAGFVAVFAMIMNVLIIMAILALMNATLTLSGIGGILLTMGMAVDANILIYERLREELDAGKPLRAAINIAFDRAFSVIFDSNLTSLLPALVLVLFEVVDGSMLGFWLSIAIGLIANMYTGIVVTRAVMEAVYAKYKTISVGTIRIFKGVNVPWMKHRWWAIGFSLITTVASIGVLSTQGFGFGVDFTGGVLATVKLDKEASQAELVGLFSDYQDVRAIRVMNTSDWQITVPLTRNSKTGEVPTLEKIKAEVETKVQAKFGKDAEIRSTQSVDAFVGGEFMMVALLSLAITCAVILTYLAFRFQWVFGAGAVLALVHDVFLSLGVFRLLGHSVTLDIVSALLIILGYSVNDTIVVFDRVREDMEKRHSASIGDIINAAVNETLSRTIFTGGSTLIAIATMYLVGGVGLSDFALILLLGVGFGTYSSIFVASALVYEYLSRTGHGNLFSNKKATARVALPKAKV